MSSFVVSVTTPLLRKKQLPFFGEKDRCLENILGSGDPGRLPGVRVIGTRFSILHQRTASFEMRSFMTVLAASIVILREGISSDSFKMFKFNISSGVQPFKKRR